MTRTFTFGIAGLLLACSSAAQMPNVVGYEYWFDQNDAARVYVPVAPSTTVNLANAQLNTSGLSLGQHQACLRWKDQPALGQARWSSVVCRMLHVGQPGPWEIVAVRYWVGTPANDSDPLIRHKYFATPQTVVSYNGLLDLCGYPTGSQTLKLQLLDNHNQWSSVVTRPVTVNAAGNLGTPTITASATTFCPGDVVTFTAAPQTGPGFATPTGYNWQIPTGNGWSALPSDSSSIVVTIGDASATVQAAGTNFCGTGPYGSMSVAIPPAPDQVPFINGPLQACVGSEATYSVPAVPGISYSWQITGGWEDNEEPEDSMTTIVGTANATISVIAQNACGVQAPPRIETITVTEPPYAGFDGSLALCSNSAPVNLFTGLQGTPDTGGVWRFNGILVPSVYNPALSAPGVYTYTIAGTGPCPDATASVTVSETPAADAGIDAALALCSSSSTQVMIDALGGTPDAGGTWTGPSTTNGLFDPATMAPGLYTYTVLGAPLCPNATASLTITVQPAPNAGVGGVLELCAGSVPMSLLNALGGSPALNGSWTGPDGTAFAGIFTPGQSAEGVYTYTVQGSGVCADASAALEVNVMELHITEINGPTSVPYVEQLLFWVLPALPDADSILWTLPTGWEWGPDDDDHYDASAYVMPDSTTGAVQICAQAVGGGCVGNDTCYTVDVSVGIAAVDAKASHLLVYPNPSNGRFVVQASFPGPVKAELLDALGQEVALLQINQQNTVVHLRDLPAGTYMLRWLADGSIGAQQIIIGK